MKNLQNEINYYFEYFTKLQGQIFSEDNYSECVKILKIFKNLETDFNKLEEDLRIKSAQDTNYFLTEISKLKNKNKKIQEENKKLIENPINKNIVEVASNNIKLIAENERMKSEIDFLRKLLTNK